MLRTLLTISMLIPLLAVAEEVNVGNFVRAESDHMLRTNLATFGIGVGEVVHIREATTPEVQPVIRMNQDTLYSAVVLDLSEPVTVTLPELGGRYQSMHLVNQDHYMFFEAKPGTYELTEESVGARFALVTIRTFVDPNDPGELFDLYVFEDGEEIRFLLVGDTGELLFGKPRDRGAEPSPDAAADPEDHDQADAAGFIRLNALRLRT